jgi:hypothetical protein
MRNNAKCTALGLCIVAGGLAMAEPAKADVLWNLKAEKQSPSKAICMGIAGGANGDEVKDGTNIIVWDCINGVDDQIWSRIPDTAFGNFFDNLNVLIEDRALDSGSPACITDKSNGTSTGDKGVQLAIGVCSQTNLAQQFLFEDMHENDPAGFPCFLIQSGLSGRFIGVANAQANPVKRGLAVIMWDRTPSDDQVWCVHPNPPPIIVP